MKQYTHAWLGFMASKRLESQKVPKTYRTSADSLVKWFKAHRDGVIRGSWYPDSMIKDMKKSHVLKLTPSDKASNKFKQLPGKYKIYEYGKSSPLRKTSFTIEKGNNLPDRCESIAQSVVDNLKMQEREEKGSPVSATDNHIATVLFMLSHYVADGHVPFHCDSRQFSEGKDIHGYVEGEWDEEIKKYYQLDEESERFYYDKHGYPLLYPDKETPYQSSFLKKVENDLADRDFSLTFGTGNDNVWDFMSAICQYSYLLSNTFIPRKYDHTNLTRDDVKAFTEPNLEEVGAAVLSDAVDSVARVWLRVWRRYLKWKKTQKAGE